MQQHLPGREPANRTPVAPSGKPCLTARVAALLDKRLAKIQAGFSADSASLWLADPDRKTIRCVMSRPGRGSACDAKAEPGESIPRPHESFLWQALALAGEPLLLPESSPPSDSRTENGVLREQASPCAWLISALEILPRPGAIVLGHARAKRYSEAELRRAQVLFLELAAAWETAQAAAADAESILESERNRMARELHDTLGQGLAGILIQLEVLGDQLNASDRKAAATLDRARNVVRESLADARRAIRALRPRSLDGGDLAGAMDQWIREMGAGVDVRLEFSTQGRIETLPEPLKADLLRIAQQSVTNALQHGRPERVRVKLAFLPGQIVLTIDDNGRGVAQPECAQRPGFGWAAMRERVQGLGGELAISSRAGHGTRVCASIPFPQSAPRGV